MRKIKLDNTLSEIPIVGFGTWQLRGEDCYQAVTTALAVGYTHIDTATVYGNEEEIGRAIIDSGISRSDLFITTKLTEDDYGDVEKALRTSLEKLQTDYIDLYLVHWPGEDRINAYKQMEELVNKGIAINIGVSNFTEQHLNEIIEYTNTIPSVNQVEFNPFLFQDNLLTFCKDNEIALEAYCPLARADKLDDERLLKISQKYNKSPAQIMLRWAVQKDVVVIPKSAHENRIKENFDIFDFEITQEDINDMDSWNEELRFCKNPNELL